MPIDKRNSFIRRYCTICYTLHTKGYDFRFNPIDFFNKLFRYMKLDYEITYINLDNG